MIVCYLRSSTLAAWDFCPFQAWLNYGLGIGGEPGDGWAVPPSHKKADKGTITHKALELLAGAKLAAQRGEAEFGNDETGGRYPADITPEQALEEAWWHYTSRLTHWDWRPTDRDDCMAWVNAACSAAGGLFDPRRRTVVWPEKYFDLPIERPWAEWPSGEDGRPGRLAIRGTVDLVVEAGDGVYELVDWKTGQRKDWSTGETKDWKKLRNDTQLRLYHYALSRLLPDAREIIISIVFLRDGGPFSLPFSREDLAATEGMLRARFEEMRCCVRPRRIKGDPTHGWKCDRLCQYELNRWPGTDRTVCDHMHAELLELGMVGATDRYRTERAAKYSGGGRT